jgi:probable HAF family extracellular repeat protein
VNNINNLGEVAGLYSPVRSTPRYGFVDDNGTYTQINVSPGFSTTASVNDAGVVVGGSYLHTVGSVEPVYTGFIDNNGTITYLNAPGTLNANGYTNASGINDADQVVGTSEATYGGLQQGFLYQNGTFTFIDDPNAGAQGTDAVAINNSGAIVGFYYDSSGKVNGFIYTGNLTTINPADFTTIDNPLGVNGTQILGINDAGQIVGTYLDSSNVEHGFVASLNGETTNEDVALMLNSISVAAADAGSNPIQVTLDVSHGALTLGTESGVTEVGLGTADVTLTGSQSAIDTALAAGLTYTPTLGYQYADVLAVTVDDEGYNVSHAAQTTTQDVGIVIAPADTVAENGTFTVNGASSDTIAFAGANGTIVFDDPSSFTGHIADISGSGDVIDLSGFATSDTASTGAGSFNAATDTTLLTVYDSSSHAAIESFNLAGDLSGSSWTVSTDGGTGIDIVDPPAAGNAPSVLSTATTDGASGTISLVDNDPASAITASVTPDGANSAGSFTLDQPTESNGIVSVGFAFNDGQVNLTTGETLTQSYNVAVADAQNPAADQAQTVSVTIGGPGNDNFVFAPGVGADTVTNFNVQQDTLSLDHFANVQTVQELQALISTDAHGDAVINLGHNDSVTLAGVTDTQLQQVIHAGHVLLH